MLLYCRRACRGVKQVGIYVHVLLGLMLLVLAFARDRGGLEQQILRMVQVAALALTLRCAVLMFQLAPASRAELWLPGALVGAVLALFSLLTASFAPWRLWLADQLRADGATFLDGSARHAAALALLVAVVVCSLSLVLESAPEYDPFNLDTVLFSTIALLSFAMLGVGFPLRRDWSLACQRLGLGSPGRKGLLLAAGLGVLLVSLMSLLWLLLTLVASPEPEDSAGAVSNPGLMTAFLTAALTALGEETMFRGLLQPVFGVALTSLCFALLHLRPGAELALLPVLLVSLALAWLRARYGTVAAILAHLVYNFTLTLTLPWYLL